MNDINGYGNLCKSHSARSEKEFCRVCPSKLNKKELEDVYFSLLESNLDLKKTINNQQDKIKVLSTKIQRLTAVQKTYLGKEKKDCCGSKAVIIDQKECILELKRSNQCLTERVRQLNMRLCSAKQFLKRSPFQSSSRCNRCNNRTASMSALISKKSETNLRTAVNSIQYLDKDILSSRSADPKIISYEKGVQYDYCEENKCRTYIEELKQKAEHLEELLSKTNCQYEHQMSELRAENLRVRSERTHAEESLKQLREESSELVKRLGAAEIRCDELSVELSIEKRKVSELEMRVRTADMSSRIANAIEAHLASIKMVKESTSELSGRIESENNQKVTPNESPRLAVPSPLYRPRAAVRTKIPHIQADEVFKNSDDSGYTEVNKSDNLDDKITSASTYINQVLLEKVADLQNQINKLKALKVYNSAETADASEGMQNTASKMINSNKSLTNDKETISCTFDDKVVSESSESVITEKNLGISTKKHGESSGETKSSYQVGEVQSTRDIVSENRLTSTETQSNVQKQQVDKNDDNKRRESFKQFKKRSKEKCSEQSKVMDTRKFSLESSKDSIIEKKLTKKVSLDDKENLKRLAKETNPKGTSISHSDDVNNDFNTNTRNIKESRNLTDRNIKDRDTYKGQLGDTKLDVKDDLVSKNNYFKQTADDTNFKNKETNNEDSDSSKRTYSIHREDNNVKDSKAAAMQNKARMKSQKYPENLSKEKQNSVIQSNSNVLAADLKRNLTKSAVSMENFMSEKRRSSTPSQMRTYVLSGKVKASSSHPLSPDSTECEISSLSDLPSERDERAYLKYRSPGEDKPLTVSESRTDTTTTDYGSLSEGELPCVPETTVLSIGETRLPNRTVKSHSLPISTSQQMEETLAMVKEELSRCTNLLKVHAQRSLDGMRRTDQV